MGIGMARQAARNACFGGLGISLALSLFLSCVAKADDAPVTPSDPPSASAPEAPPLSAQCDVPAVDIAAPAPLPNVAELLKKGHVVKILAIGSSSTLGIGATSGVQSYPAQLTVILEAALKGVDVEILNRGVAGEIAATTADRIRSEVALSKPDLVLWQLGTNDALARVPLDEFEQTVKSTVDWLKSDKIDVVLVGMQYTSRFAKDQNYFAVRDLLQKIAADENILYIRRYDAMQFIAKTRANLEMMSRDNFHLNDLGYHCMAEHVAHAVIVSLFVRKLRPKVP
jgi:lysophospholipase L1-like esterase